MPESARSSCFETIIVGAGFAGIGMGARLRMSGRDDFVILEKAAEVGGTWRDNVYPGAECDIPSALYSYSFAANPTWQFKWARQAQILGYLKQVAGDFGVTAHLRLGQQVIRADFEPSTVTWTLVTAAGQQWRCRYFICALGQLHHPQLPDLPGRDRFQGRSFHSARWPAGLDLAGKRVAVVGSAASAVQLIPEIAPQCARLTVYQRSANWVLPKKDRPYGRLELALARHFPALARLYRLHLWWQGEYLLYPTIRGARWRAALLRRRSRKALQAAIRDSDMRRALTPDYPIGAKRVLLSDHYFAALARRNVELVTEPVERVVAQGICVGGTERGHDVIVYATGFRTNPFIQSIQVTGRRGRQLAHHWGQGAHAYLGVVTHGFPNLFMLYGPNTNTGHTSVIYMLEAQFKYILQLIEKNMVIEVNSADESAFNQHLQQRMQGLAWSSVKASWYLDRGRNTNNWPGSALEYHRLLRRPDWSHFLQVQDKADANPTADAG